MERSWQGRAGTILPRVEEWDKGKVWGHSVPEKEGCSSIANRLCYANATLLRGLPAVSVKPMSIL
jgi:hypothetical protein